MEFRIETHLHTREGSACASATGAEQARAKKAQGYDAIIVTDHFYRGNTRPDRSLPWEEYVRQFAKGYESACEEGKKIGLTVWFGWEDNFHGAEFLCYGPDPQWLIAHPEMTGWSPKSLYLAVKEAGGMVIQAHPFRQRDYLEGISIYPNWCDGIEAFNLSQPHEQNLHAKWYGESFRLPMIGGSDTHSTDYIGGGVAFSRRIHSLQDFNQAVLSGEPMRILGVAEEPGLQ